MSDNNCRNKKSEQSLRETVDFLKIISEENRLRILCILQKREMCVCEIWGFLNLPQNLVSHHLKVLKDFGLVGSKKESTKVIYYPKPENTKKYISLLARYI